MRTIACGAVGELCRARASLRIRRPCDDRAVIESPRVALVMGLLAWFGTCLGLLVTGIGLALRPGELFLRKQRG